MAPRDGQTPVYHITDIDNLAPIVDGGYLLSDALIAQQDHSVIGYDHMKRRRLDELTVDCCGNRFVGEFVPFYYAPRMPMLFVINQGRTGMPVGHQANIVHLMSTVAFGVACDAEWAISDGNAGARGVTFRADVNFLNELDWRAIDARSWSGVTRQKQAEFLVADRFPWSSIFKIGCYDINALKRVQSVLGRFPGTAHHPLLQVAVERNWYY